MDDVDEVGKLVLAAAGVGDFVEFLGGARQIALAKNLGVRSVWPQAEALGESEFADAHRPFLDGPLTIDSIDFAPLSTIRNSIVVVDLDTSLFTPRYLAPMARDAFLVPDFAWTMWSEKQRDWLKSNCEKLPVQEVSDVAAQGREIVEALIANNNVTIISEAFEYVSPELRSSTEAASELVGVLEEVNLLSRSLSADHGALLMHSHTGMAYEGALALQTDCRKHGGKASKVLLAELDRVLGDGGGMDVFEE